MSHHSPTGFAFGILIEIAAVVAVVSFLPRIDLRPPAVAGTGQSFAQGRFGQPAANEPAVAPVSWTQTDRGSSDASQASHYQRPTAQPAANSPQPGSFSTQTAPSLIASDPARPQYVEQRLDRASQQLVNSVGSAVSHATSNLLRYPPSAASSPPTSSSTTSSVATVERPTAVALPASASARRPRTGSASAQPRPWIRY